MSSPDLLARSITIKLDEERSSTESRIGAVKETTLDLFDDVAATSLTIMESELGSAGTLSRFDTNFVNINTTPVTLDAVLLHFSLEVIFWVKLSIHNYIIGVTRRRKMAVAGIRRALVPSRDGRDGKSSKSDELHY
jgi:hypothetical protein